MSFRSFGFSWAVIVGGMFFSLVSPSWFGAWVGMELNLFGILPLLVSKHRFAVNSAFKYFFVQGFGSSVIIMSIMVSFWAVDSSLASYGVLFGLLVKVGAVPFHFWVIEVLSNLSPDMIFVLLTLQKVAPLGLVCQIHNYSLFIFIFSGVSSIFGSVWGLGSRSMDELVGYSSIAHTGWSLGACLGGLSYLFFYLFIYWVSLSGLVYTLKSSGFLSICFSSELAWLFIFSLGGFPPLIGFLGKISVLSVVLKSSTFLSLVLVAGSLVSWGFYLSAFVFSSLFGVVNGAEGGRSLRPSILFFFFNVFIFFCFLLLF